MDFEFSEEQQAFAKEVVAFCDEHDDIDIFDVTRENMAQIVDTPERRAFMKELGHKGWLGMTWPERVRRHRGRGRLRVHPQRGARRPRRPPDRQGRRHHRQDADRATGRTSSRTKFLPMILENDVEFAVGYSEPNAGSDAASMRLKGVRHTNEDGVTGWLLNGQKTWTTSAHFAEWYWCGVRTDPDNKHMGITLDAHPARPPGHHHQRHLDHGRRAHQRGLARRRVRARRVRRGRGQPRVPLHLPGARPRALHDVHLQRRSSSGSTC